jgi:hypothetical protein
VLYTLAGKCILKASKRASYYYGVNTMGNVLFYIIVICQPAKLYKQGKDSQGFIMWKTLAPLSLMGEHVSVVIPPLFLKHHIVKQLHFRPHFLIGL